MSAGGDRHIVRLREPTEVDDTKGGKVLGFTDDGPLLFCEVRDVTAREQAIAGAVQGLATQQVSLPYTPRITTECRLARVLPTGKDLQILGIRDLDGRQWRLVLDCSEAVSNANA